MFMDTTHTIIKTTFRNKPDNGRSDLMSHTPTIRNMGEG
jgi:hypothetical protein